MIIVKAQKLISKPTLPRKWKAPKRFEVGTGETEFHASVEDHYSAIYYETLEFIIQCIGDRFDQVEYRMYIKLETLLRKQVEHKSELDYVKELYGDDINYYSDLEVQFQTIAPVVKGKVSLREIQYLASLS